MNRLKIAFHSFVDANAKSNVRAKLGCCAAVQLRYTKLHKGME